MSTTSSSRATVGQVFQYIQMLNPNRSTHSSIGTYTTNSDRLVAEGALAEVRNYLPEGSIAHQASTFSEKQLWAIAYKLVETDYAVMVAQTYARHAAEAQAKKAANAIKKVEAADKKAAKNATEIYKVDGRTFTAYEEVIAYCEAQGFRVTNTTSFEFKGKKTNIVNISRA